MALNFYQVKQYYDQRLTSLELVEDAVTLFIRQLRVSMNADGKSDPIYAVTSRIKKMGSLYLKAKRRQFDEPKELEGLEDFVGIRLLCLFEQELLKVNDFLLAELASRRETILLREFAAYNWHKGPAIAMQITAKNYFQRTRAIAKLKRILNDDTIKQSVSVIQKESGYKSIHYNIYIKVKQVWYPVEIQLRTIIQDVWAQIEHALSYKKTDVDPHVREGFRYLAKHLDSVDHLVGHLREITDKASLTTQYFQERYRPGSWLVYEDGIIPDLFLSEGNKSISYKSYNKQALKYRRTFTSEEMQEWLAEIWKRLIVLDAAIPYHENKIELWYWFAMEVAFLLFCGPLPVQNWQSVSDGYVKQVLATIDRDEDSLSGHKHYDAALNIYKQLLARQSQEEKIFFSNRYALHFRIGEIYHVKGCAEDAFKEF
ncbi:MAG: hypothetical protein HQM03_14140 [Magnetococcales bacterium]|nr:hypothetical protein [Magnetococcales bacterium]